VIHVVVFPNGKNGYFVGSVQMSAQHALLWSTLH